MLQGIAASQGIAIGRAFVLKEPDLSFSTRQLDRAELGAEVARFRAAVEKSKEQLTAIKERAERELGAEKAAIFGAHLMFLDDPALIDEVIQQIESRAQNAEPILQEVVANFAAMFESMEDEYMRERAADIRDVGTRLLANLLNVNLTNLADLKEEVIVIAHDLTPSDTAQMNKDKVLGFATDIGGRTSHTAIMARSLEIPAVVGLGKVVDSVNQADLVIVDGNGGKVIIRPTSEELAHYEKLRQDFLAMREELKKLKDLPAETTDGHRVELAANIGTPKDLPGALAQGAEGIGLYRTEFLYMDRPDLPGEEEQFAAYKAVAEGMQSRPVIIRTLDIGGDKKLPYLPMPDELNPFLGWRAIRLCLDRPDIFKTQLRAILRASAYGKVLIMYPMVSNVEEVRQANKLVAECKEELRAEGKPFDENIAVGIMVEIPAAAMSADILAKEVDFFSIGTNDLIQYTMAADRMNEHISHLYQPFHPAVLRLIENVINASHQAGIWTGMCGEMAGEVLAAPILLGMGLDEFSMSATSIPQVKKVIRSLTLAQAKEIKKKAMSLSTAEEIHRYMQEVVASL